MELNTSLRHIINYKVLKPNSLGFLQRKQFKTYHKLQGSQTLICMLKVSLKFKTYHKLQGSQTLSGWLLFEFPFKTYHKLQGSQTINVSHETFLEFKTYHKLQGSQTPYIFIKRRASLRHIINYKVLKL